MTDTTQFDAKEPLEDSIKDERVAEVIRFVDYELCSLNPNGAQNHHVGTIRANILGRLEMMGPLRMQTFRSYGDIDPSNYQAVIRNLQKAIEEFDIDVGQTMTHPDDIKYIRTEEKYVA